MTEVFNQGFLIQQQKQVLEGIQDLLPNSEKRQ